jgi:hypothetical protein
VGRRTARRKQKRICQFDNRKSAQVLHIHDVTRDAQQGKAEGEAVDYAEEDLDYDDGIDEAREQFL